MMIEVSTSYDSDDKIASFIDVQDAINFVKEKLKTIETCPFYSIYDSDNEDEVYAFYEEPPGYYLVFSGKHPFTKGGRDDFSSSFDELKSAEEFAKFASKGTDNWAQIVDHHSMKMMAYYDEGEKVE